MSFYQNNPYAGSNSYSCKAEGAACPSTLKVETGAYVSGNTAQAECFAYFDTPLAAAPQVQSAAAGIDFTAGVAGPAAGGADAAVPAAAPTAAAAASSARHACSAAGAAIVALGAWAGLP